MKVLLSIKPEFALKIFEGKKKFEFRKIIFKNPQVKTVVVYASSPLQKVIGEFDIDDIITLTPKDLWMVTKEFSGISESLFFEYFADKQLAHAIKIKRTRKYRKPLCLREDFKLLPPQSYMYISA